MRGHLWNSITRYPRHRNKIEPLDAFVMSRQKWHHVLVIYFNMVAIWPYYATWFASLATRNKCHPWNSTQKVLERRKKFPARALLTCRFWCQMNADKFQTKPITANSPHPPLTQRDRQAQIKYVRSLKWYRLCLGLKTIMPDNKITPCSCFLVFVDRNKFWASTRVLVPTQQTATPKRNRAYGLWECCGRKVSWDQWISDKFYQTRLFTKKLSKYICCDKFRLTRIQIPK